MTNQQAPEIYTLHTVPNKGERPWSGIYTVRADALPIRKYHPRPIGRQSSTKVVADLLLSGPKNLMSIQKALVYEGYASNSCYGILQRMHAKSLVEQVGANYQLSSSNQEKK